MQATKEKVIDVQDLLQRYTLEELNRASDEYFHRFENSEATGELLAKPFISLLEAPTLLIGFGHVLQGLRLAPGMVVLDFGAGAGWSSRCLTQLGCKVIACDVSETALRLGKQCYELYPIQGHRPEPSFLLFDGRRLDLADGSVDRINCLHAFHHVPNQEEVLAEMARVLRPGGIAAFHEPGPIHSLSPQSQHEMRHFTVIENDIVLDEIEARARRAGFTDIDVAYFTGEFTPLTPEEFLAHRDGAAPPPAMATLFTRTKLREQTVFFLYRYGKDERTSRQATGLRAELQLDPASATIPADTPFEVTLYARNAGEATWLPTSAGRGAVNVGVRLETGAGLVEFSRLALPEPAGYGFFPGDEVRVVGTLPGLPRGRHRLVFDLVSEVVCWFEAVGSSPAKVTVDAV
jgi:SAM-dependent methyltransferase